VSSQGVGRALVLEVGEISSLRTENVPEPGDMDMVLLFEGLAQARTVDDGDDHLLGLVG
jgi:hypothetical protein